MTVYAGMIADERLVIGAFATGELTAAQAALTADATLGDPRVTIS